MESCREPVLNSNPGTGLSSGVIEGSEGNLMDKTWRFIADYSLLLVSGAVLALVWANINPHSYENIIDGVLLKDSFIGYHKYGAESGRVLTFHYLINDVLMAFFFAVAGKEVWEAVALKDGSLRGRKAFTPLLATAGGMVGPIAIYLGIAILLGSETYSAVANGWAIPTATDIAFSYLIGRLIFGRGHPAVAFLLLLAIADDAAGLIILAVFYPSGELQPEWLLLPLFATVAVYILFNWLPRHLDDRASPGSRTVSTFVERRFLAIPYIVGGALCWYGFQESGLHPALGLLPIVVAIPHSDHDYGLFVHAEPKRLDMLNRIEHALEKPVEFILFFFGLANAGVVFSAFGTPTVLVLLGLIVGKPVGIFLFGWIAAGPMRLGIPNGMKLSDILIVGFIAAIGFTVSLFIASVAFDQGPVQDAAKMGALLSLGSAVLAFIVARFFPVEKVE